MFCVEIDPSEVFFRTRTGERDRVTNEFGRVFIQQNMPYIKFIEDLGDIQLFIAKYYLVKQSSSIEEMLRTTPSCMFYSARTGTEQSQYKSSVGEALTSPRFPVTEYLPTTPDMKHIIPVLDRILRQESLEVISQNGRLFLNLDGIEWKT
jgi:hypothetical protein